LRQFGIKVEVQHLAAVHEVIEAHLSQMQSMSVNLSTHVTS
jgi:hypothetical protein